MQAGPSRPGHHSPRIFRSSFPKAPLCCRTSRAAAPPGPENRAACKGDTHPPARRRDRPALRPAGRLRPRPSRRCSHGNRHWRQRGPGQGSPRAQGTGRKGRGDASHPPAVDQGPALGSPGPQAARLRVRPAPPLHGRPPASAALLFSRLPADWPAPVAPPPQLAGRAAKYQRSPRQQPTVVRRGGANAFPPKRQWPKGPKPQRLAKPPGERGMGGGAGTGRSRLPAARTGVAKEETTTAPPSTAWLYLFADISSTSARSPAPHPRTANLPHHRLIKSFN